MKEGGRGHQNYIWTRAETVKNWYQYILIEHSACQAVEKPVPKRFWNKKKVSLWELNLDSLHSMHIKTAFHFYQVGILLKILQIMQKCWFWWILITHKAKLATASASTYPVRFCTLVSPSLNNVSTTDFKHIQN